MCAEKPETIVEIGPGQGALTAYLLDSGARVQAIEVDPRMVEVLRRRFGDKLAIHHADVLETDLGQWGPAALAGNLPYYITSPILDRIFAARSQLRNATLLIQREVANRLIAGPGSRDYGYLSVTTQTRASVRILMPVPPGAFHPPPKVESAVVHLDIFPDGDTPEPFLRFAGLAFKQKRKTLRNNLQAHYRDAQWESMRERGLRAEQLSIAELRALWRLLDASGARAAEEDRRQP